MVLRVRKVNLDEMVVVEFLELLVYLVYQVIY
ncbi:unnamed protein product [Trichobilharzia regenti]|nr:unnamed protein product [Trichobilharzia regenti]